MDNKDNKDNKDNNNNKKPQPKRKMSNLQLILSLILTILSLILTYLIVNFFLGIFGPKTITMTISDFENQIRNGAVTTEVVIYKKNSGYDVKFERIDEEGKKRFKIYYPDGSLLADLRKLLIAKEVPYSAEDATGGFLLTLLTWLPMLLLFGIFLYFMKRQGMMGGKGSIFSLGKSKAKLIMSDSEEKVTFDDVAGIKEAKEELQENIEFLRDPKKFTRLGGRIPKGTLLVGAPGTGKTLLARAVAGEAEVPFFIISGSDFVEMFVGLGASRVRDLFVQCKKHAPCIIFIDELDAVGRKRGAGLGGGHDEREQTLNQLLVEMDGFESNEGVIMISATNRPDVLDPALLRPGRFDRQVVVPIPDVKGREAILKIHAKNKPLEDDVNLEDLAKGTPGLTGADLENITNEAALLAVRRGHDKISQKDLEDAKDKVMMGTESKSKVISPAEKKMIAYHEAGHALIIQLLRPITDPVHKVTIIPRGRSLGSTHQLPEQEKLLQTKNGLKALLKVLLGGRIAEELIFKDVSTGAGNDLERFTELAKMMVTQWGMSDLGLRTFGKAGGDIFLGRDLGLAQQKDYSEDAAKKIDGEIDKLVAECQTEVVKMIEDNKGKLNEIAEALIEHETLGREDIEKFFQTS